MSDSYKRRKPRSFNWVTVLLVLLALAAGYAGWKLGPVYYRKYKVQSVLQDIGYQSIDLPGGGDQSALRDRLIADTRARLAELGVDDPYLNVYYDEPDFTAIHADYAVTIRHPFIEKTTRLEFQCKAPVPQSKLLNP